MLILQELAESWNDATQGDALWTIVPMLTLWKAYRIVHNPLGFSPKACNNFSPSSDKLFFEKNS